MNYQTKTLRETVQNPYISQPKNYKLTNKSLLSITWEMKYWNQYIDNPTIFNPLQLHKAYNLCYN